MERNKQLEEKVKKSLSRIRMNFDIDRLIIEGNLITVRILNPKYEDDRNNVIDIEGETIKDAVRIIANKHDHSLPDFEMRNILFAIGTVLNLELIF